MADIFMMTSSNGNIFRVTGPLRGEFTGHRWIPLKSSSFIFQQIYNAHNLTKHNAWNIIRWWLSGECKAHLADNQTEKIER